MPTYMGQAVDQGFLDMLTYIYKGGYVAMHPAHVAPVESDATLMATSRGWYCEDCGYQQAWAHGFMAEKAKENDHSSPHG